MISEFFEVNRIGVLFVYGLSFYTMGVAILLQFRKHSRLRLARDLKWLALFGILHGIHEWGQIFIPIQETYLSAELIDLLETVQVFLLVASFACLLKFGTVVAGISSTVVTMSLYAWSVISILFAYHAYADSETLTIMSNIARYAMCLPGALLSAYGLRKQALEDISPLNANHIYNTLRIAGISLFAYAIFAGLLVQDMPFFPANIINSELIERVFPVPVELWRSLCGFVLMVTMIRVLELFNVEIDRMIERMEIEQIQSAERERIGQEIHDGAMQGIYSASLILQSINGYIDDKSEAAQRLQQAKQVLDSVNKDLRSYMQSLRQIPSTKTLSENLHTMVNDPRFKGLLNIELICNVEPQYLQPMQANHVLAIVQECLANVVRHAQATRVTLIISENNQALSIRIQDNGCGFIPDTLHTGYGIRSMRDKARLLGASLTIDSAPGQGTRIILKLNRTNNYDTSSPIAS